LIRGRDLELGRDADTGGQTKYVVELAKALAKQPNVRRVDLVTRRIIDSEVGADYAELVEPLAENAQIVRIEVGPEAYICKEELWDHLDSFADNLLTWLHQQPRLPDILHSHYADAGYVGVHLSHWTGLPLIHTGHSLGRDKCRRLLANGRQPESACARATFSRLVSRPEVTLAYVSGRHRELVEDAIREYELPLPDWVIGDVGTTIYQVRTGEWRHWSEWEQDIANDWRGLTAKYLRPLFADLSSLRLQDEAKQNRHKLSYYLPLLTNIDTLQREMLWRLETQKVAANLIYSVDEATSMGLLDVLPAHATKLHALEFLMQHQGFDYANTVFAGGSGNDLPVLASMIQSVLVANADDDVVEQAKTQAQKQGSMAAFYLAQGSFLGMNGNYSAGILEGFAHYHPDTRVWMEQNHEQ
jgi:hypothetical protein